MLAASGLLELLLVPANLVFVVPLALGLALFAFQLVGFGLSEAGEHDVDLDHDVDVAHDVDVDHDVEVEHDIDHDGLALGDALRFMNVGRVPFMAVLQAVLLSFGLFGLVAAFLLGPRLEATVPIAFVVGVAFAKLLTGAIAKVAPTIETKEIRLARLLGEQVVVESAQVDEREGRASFQGAGGHLITVYVRTAPGARPIAKGAKARLERFDPEAKVFLCTEGSDSCSSPTSP